MFFPLCTVDANNKTFIFKCVKSAKNINTYQRIKTIESTVVYR